MKSAAMIFAAGRGERFRPHTDQVAKPALPFLNVPLLAYSHQWFKTLGIENWVVNTHHQPKSLESSLGHLAHKGKEAQLSHESPNILGSGGGLKKAQRFFDTWSTELIWLFNGDSVYLMPEPQNLLELQEQHLQQKPLATLLLASHPGAGVDFGAAWVNSRGEIKGFGLKDPQKHSGLQPYHYTGTMLVSPLVFEHIPEEPEASNIIYQALLPAIEQGEVVRAYVDSEVYCFETGNLKDYLKAHETCLKLLTRPSGELSPLEQSHRHQLMDFLSRYSPGWDNFRWNNLWSKHSLEKLKLAWQKTGNDSINHQPMGLIATPIHSLKNIQIKDWVVIGEQVVSDQQTALPDSIELQATVVRAGAQLPSAEEKISGQLIL